MAHQARPHPPVRVAMTTLTAGLVELGMFTSWDKLRNFDVVGYDGEGGCQHVLRGGTIKLQSGPRVAEGRTLIGRDYLEQDVLKGVDWILLIDSDMTYDPDALCQLLGHAYAGNADADPYEPERPIIGALCFGGHRGRIFPTIYKAVEQEAWDGSTHVLPEPVDDYPRDGLVQVHATGAAFLLVHRKVLHHMALPHPRGFGTFPDGSPNPHPWFVEGISKGIQFGEDIAFCQRAGALGYPVHVHTGVKTGHLKKWEINEHEFDLYRAEQKRKAKEAA